MFEASIILNLKVEVDPGWITSFHHHEVLNFSVGESRFHCEKMEMEWKQKKHLITLSRKKIWLDSIFTFRICSHLPGGGIAII